jgi:hypothetical protein
MPQPVRHFRQILIWPLQVMPIREGAQIQEPWDLLQNSQSEHSWRVLEDEFGDQPDKFQERHYSEFVTFLPYVRRFLYGEGASRGGTVKGAESPLPCIPPQRRHQRSHDLSGNGIGACDVRRRARRPLFPLRHRRR